MIPRNDISSNMEINDIIKIISKIPLEEIFELKLIFEKVSFEAIINRIRLIVIIEMTITFLKEKLSKFNPKEYNSFSKIKLTIIAARNEESNKSKFK